MAIRSKRLPYRNNNIKKLTLEATSLLLFIEAKTSPTQKEPKHPISTAVISQYK